MGKRINFDLGGRKKAEIARKKGLAKGLAAGIAAGSAIGALSGLLFAPKSGKETRQKISDDVSDAAKKAVSDIKDAGEKAAGNIKEVGEKAAINIKDMATKTNDLINKKIKNKIQTEDNDDSEISVTNSCNFTEENDTAIEEEKCYSSENMEEDTLEEDKL